MEAIQERLTHLLDRQHQVISRGQALAVGLTESMLRHRLRRGGPWQFLLPGVYLAVTGTPTQDQRDIAALLYAGAGSALTGSRALRWHGFRGRLPSVTAIDVLVPAKRRRQSVSYVTVHQTTKMPELVCYQGAIQFVLPARAVADSARALSDFAAVRSLVATAVRAQHCTIEQLAGELRSGPRRGSAFMSAALSEVAGGVRSASEGDLMELIKRGRLPTPLFNARLFCGDELLAVPDAWWQDLGVAAEADSKEWHLSPDAWEATMRRHARMTSLGILVLHFTPRQIKYEPDYVLTSIRAALQSRRGHPPLPIKARPASG